MLPLIIAASVALGGTPGFDPYSASSTGASVCASGPVVEGLDVSTYEGSIDWTKVKAAGIGFGIARISDGLNYPDGTFDTNYAAMKAQGIVRGSYQYFEPAQDPVAQANMVLQHIGTLGPGDLPPFLDVETHGGLAVSAVVTAMDTWLSTIQNAIGKRPLVYTSPSFRDGLSNPTLNTDLWIANWGVTCPSVPAPWGGWQFWQYTSTGTVSGVPVTAVDLDRFNGTMADLLAYAGGGATPPPAPSAVITSPAAGATLTGTVTVSASGNASAARIELYADTALLGTGSSISWDTTTVADGAHQLTAKAYDASGASTTSAPVSVTVSNSTGTGGCSGIAWLNAACPPPPTGCSTQTSGWALLAGLLALAFQSRRRT